MKVALTGSSGLIGSALVPLFEGAGHDVLRLVRRPAAGDTELQWDPIGGFPQGTGRLEGCGAVVHLAGEGIADRRWTAERKARIRESRVAGTRTLCEALATLKDKPKVLISASALGFYGDTGDRVVDESEPAGSGFLPDVCKEWEAQTRTAKDAGIRVVLARTGIVLDARGGALAKMLPVFRLGIGAPLGGGNQYMSWIALGDQARAIVHCIAETGIAGPVNFAAPNPVTNCEFTRTLARVLGRPVMPCVPGAALRLLMGEMADEALLVGTRLLPRRLLESGFKFKSPDLEEALRAALHAPE